MSSASSNLDPKTILPVVNPVKELDPTGVPVSAVDEVLTKQIAEQNQQGKKYQSPAPLTDTQLEEAKVALVNKDYIHFSFPRQIRMRVDPAIPGQTYTVISFYPSKQAVPDSDGRFGTLKVRGCYSDVMECEDKISEILRKVDSLVCQFRWFRWKRTSNCLEHDGIYKSDTGS